MGPLCAGLAADRFAGLVKSQRACRRGGGIWEGLAESRPLLPGVVRGRSDRVPCWEVGVVGFFQVVLSWLLIYCAAEKEGSPSHMGLTSMADDWIEMG